MERAQLIKHMLSELESPARRLTTWELSFLESVADQFTNRGTLSDKQVEKLTAIYEEKSA